MQKSGTPKNKLVDFSVCTQDNKHRLDNGFKSFPSGHSSFAFSGLGYTALLLTSQTRALDPHTPLPLAILPIVSLLAPLLIAISRTEDYRHDVWDVTAGSALGILIALGSYRRYYPGLRTRRCETPHPNRAELMANGKAKGTTKDEELALREGENRDPEFDLDDEDSSREGSRGSGGSGDQGRERRTGRSK
ncbi:MAG: hypothetical protein M1831_003701 [Alyxoria varia]|nr:MAG: hypothetical protein M1831_003701 [Alyxoria varia]